MLILFLSKRNKAYFEIFREQLENNPNAIHFLDDEYEQFCDHISGSWNGLAEAYRAMPEALREKHIQESKSLIVQCACQLPATDRCFKFQMTVSIREDEDYYVERVEPIIDLTEIKLKLFNEIKQSDRKNIPKFFS